MRDAEAFALWATALLGILLLVGVMGLITGQPGWGTSTHTELPPLTGQIAFQTDRTGFLQDEIFLMEADGSDPRNLTNQPRNRRPTWSPDGTRIAFGSNRTGDPEIFVMNPDGTNVIQLTETPGKDTDPAWSPDGGTIVFVSSRSGDQEVWAMNPDGTNPRNLTSFPGDERDPDWSRDSRFVLFSALRALPSLDIFIMNADGSDQRRWTVTDKADHNTSWHPFQPRVVYHSHEGVPRGGNLWVAEVDGEGNILARSQVTGVRSIVGDEHPAWSPDGSKVVFNSDRDKRPIELYVMDPDGSNITRLTDNNALDCCAKWSPRPQRARNVSFERDTDSNGIPDDWQAVNFETGDGRTSLETKVGAFALQLRGNPILDKRLTQNLALAGDAGQTLTLATWAKSTGLSAEAPFQVTITLFHPNSREDTFSMRLPQNTPWRYREKTFTAPQAFTYALIQVQLGFQSGAAWVDSFALYTKGR